MASDCADINAMHLLLHVFTIACTEIFTLCVKNIYCDELDSIKHFVALVVKLSGRDGMKSRCNGMVICRMVSDVGR